MNETQLIKQIKFARLKPSGSQNLWLIFLSLFFILSYSFNLQAKLTQSIDRTEIHAGESFLLTLEVDQDAGAEPDLSLIPKDLTIVSTSQYQQMSYINGRSSVIKGWKINLSTLKTGKITIPSITIGQEKSKPIHLLIKSSSDRVELNGQEKAIFLKTSVDHENIYVQQQVILTIKLYRAINIHYARLTEPTAGDSIVEKLGEDVQYDKMINNTRYVVTERRYAIFPQQSGELEIEAVNFTAEVNDSSASRRNRFLNTTRPVSINSKIIKLKVKPQPANSSNPWMPASNVVLAGKWSSSSNQLTVGEPVTWTILLSVQGLSESQLGEISLPKVQGVQWYPDTPQKERQINQQGILAQKTEKLAVIPSKEGALTIPEIQIKWWDVSSDSEKTATLAARTFNVLPATNNAGNVRPSQTIEAINNSEKTQHSSSASHWKNTTYLVLLLWLLTLIAYFKKNTAISSSNKQVNKQQGDKASKNPTSSTLLKQLTQAIKSDQTQKIEVLLIRWAANLSKKPTHSLGDLIKQLNNKKLIEKISQLEAQRYAADEKNAPCDLNPSDLKKLSEELIDSNQKPNNNIIPPLYSS